MPLMTERRDRLLEALDRRQTAVHEAGHVVIARELQIPHMGATLLRSEISDQEFLRWSGFTRAILAGLSKPKQAMFGVAGRVAEACWWKETLNNVDWDNPEEMSPEVAGRACPL
jgi:hypothetical protein